MQITESRDTAALHDRRAAERWIRSFIDPTAPIETARAGPWSTVLRVPVAGGCAWFKACSPVQTFEPRLSAELFDRWPDRVGEVLAYDEQRAWLLLADAGAGIHAAGTPPQAWLEALPLYAELQRGEVAQSDAHLAHGVPPLLLSTLPARYSELLDINLPIEPHAVELLRAFAPRFEQLCVGIAAAGLPPTIQHDDLHIGSLYRRDGRLRLLDWGDSSVSHPFFSLFVTFGFPENRTGVPREDRWFRRLRDAYLEPWGRDLGDIFEPAMEAGRFAHIIAWSRQREFLPPPKRATLDDALARVLWRAAVANATG